MVVSVCAYVYFWKGRGGDIADLSMVSKDFSLVFGGEGGPYVCFSLKEKTDPALIGCVGGGMDSVCANPSGCVAPSGLRGSDRGCPTGTGSSGSGSGVGTAGASCVCVVHVYFHLQWAPPLPTNTGQRLFGLPSGLTRCC